MQQVLIGFKAYDPHELLCHFVALDAGLYQANGLEPVLKDLTFTSEDQLPEACFQVACGSALCAAIKGQRLRLLLVAVNKPLFWLMSRQPLTQLQETGARVAGFPPGTPPAYLLNAWWRSLLHKAPLVQVPARDDLARLGLLRSGAVEAALVSSACLINQYPFSAAVDRFVLGDDLLMPTTGLAVHEREIANNPDLVRPVVQTHSAALKLIQSDTERVKKVLRDWFGAPESSLDASASLLARYFNPVGVCEDELLLHAVQKMACAMEQDIDPQGVTACYDFSYLME